MKNELEWKYFQNNEVIKEEAVRAGLELFCKKDYITEAEFCTEFFQFGSDLMGMILASLMSIHNNEGDLQECDLSQVFTMFTGEPALGLVRDDNNHD